ncbi:MAG: bacterial extracellular solute-binding s, 5 Middle family protein, partial [Thermoleophilia bacterium]|nr:bacterial extracellular solute-binding s, 5 Middle family protein [Thermoleophilia bacterium]
MSVSVRRMLLSASVIVTAALVAVGCGGSSSDGGNSSKSAGSQNLVVGVGAGSDPGNFDPTTINAYDTVNRNNSIWSNLYRYDKSGQKLVPFLATEAPQVSSDGLTYTVKMRSDAKWSDGKPLVADDMVFGVQHALDPATAAPFASFILAIQGACEYFSGGKDLKNKCAEYQTDKTTLTDGSADAVGVTALDDHTVQFKLNKVVPWFDQLLSLQVFIPLRKDIVTKYGKTWDE